LSKDELGRLGSYRVLSIVGSGGMGVVYRAHDPQLDRIVAVKAMLPNLATNPIARERFLREARAAASLQHDHIVTIYQVGEERGVPYLAMPYLKGESLEQRLINEGKPLTVDETLRIAREIAVGLAALHDKGLVHRDIKPANIFLEGEPRRVKILDFGLARAMTADVQLTLEGTIVGSPAFMAPEQASRQPIDGRADLYSLGCVMYLMLTGTLPFEGDDAVTMLVAVQTTKPIALSERNVTVKGELSDLVMQLLAKKPGERPASAQVVMEAIRGLEACNC
jgi:serine/threonine protein kinase